MAPLSVKSSVATRPSLQSSALAQNGTIVETYRHARNLRVRERFMAQPFKKPPLEIKPELAGVQYRKAQAVAASFRIRYRLPDCLSLTRQSKSGPFLGHRADDLLVHADEAPPFPARLGRQLVGRVETDL